jgi:tetratricopeptide (TPR) repeat protein
MTDQENEKDWISDIFDACEAADEGEAQRVEKLKSLVGRLFGTSVSEIPSALEKRAARTVFEEARTLAETGQIQEALEYFDTALRLDPTFEDALFSRALLHAERGDLVAAIADYDAVVSVAPTHVHALVNRALLWIALGDFARARTDFLRTGDLVPRDLATFVDRATLRIRMDDFDGARQDCLAAIHLLPTDLFSPSEVRRVLGTLLEAARLAAPDGALHRRLPRGYSAVHEDKGEIQS